MANPVIDKGIGRLAYQFTNSPNLKAFLEAFLQQFQDLDVSRLQLLNERYLETAIGVQLDGIGEIVGIDRPRAPSDLEDAFGFLNDPTSLGFTDFYDLDLGGRWASFYEVRGFVDDDIYRQLIRAKIIKNQTAMTVDDTLRLISFAYGDIEVRYFLIENLKVRYDIGKLLTPYEKELFAFFPILIGIEDVVYWTSYNGNDSFSFANDISGKGFGDFNDSDLGGNFARILDQP